MSTLKQLRLRISGVKSTEKITKAMKMVAASKLFKAQDAKEHGKPYANKMYNMVAHLSSPLSEDDLPELLIGNGKDKTHLLVVASSDKGLCGGFNTSIVKTVKAQVKLLKSQDKIYKIFCVGKKAFEQLKIHYNDDIIGVTTGFTSANYTESNKLASKLIHLFENGEFDICTFIYTEFLSAMNQTPSIRKLIPLNEELNHHTADHIYEYEPNSTIMLNHILPLNLAVQIYYIALENIASEHGSRMMAMDAATNNAKDMIDSLTLLYNRSRQATITRELIEIISSAEVV